MKNRAGNAGRWLRQAEHDLAVARVVLREAFHSQACFMAHQVGEKTLKALAYYRGDRFVVGHSLMSLADALEATYPQLAKYRKLVRVLDRYYIPTRYPDAVPGGLPFEVYDDPDEAQAAVDGAASMVETATSMIDR